MRSVDSGALLAIGRGHVTRPEDAVARTIESMRVAATGPWGQDSSVVESRARYIIQTDEPDMESAKRIEDWVLARTNYMADPCTAEAIVTPETMLEHELRHGQCYGDADEIAVLVAALGLSVGMDAQFVLVTFDGRPHPTHVFARLKTRDAAWEPDPFAKKPYAGQVVAWTSTDVQS